MSTITVVKRIWTGKSLFAGVVAGIGGGVVFGMMMAMMNMLPMIAGLVGSTSPVVGGLVHMAISAAIGVFYAVAVTLGDFRPGAVFAVLSGMVNGVLWWVLGALILMPLGLGMANMVLQIGTAQWLSLMGHVIYGVVTGLLYLALIRRN